MGEIIFKNTAEEFIHELRAANIPGIEIYETMAKSFPPDVYGLITREKIKTFTIKIITPIAIELLVSFISNYCNKPDSPTIIINQINITNTISIQEIETIITNSKSNNVEIKIMSN